MAEGARPMRLDDVGGGVVGGDRVDDRLSRRGFASVGMLFLLDQLPGGTGAVVVAAVAVGIGGAAAVVGVLLLPGLDEGGLQGLKAISQIADGLADFGHPSGDDFPSRGSFDFAYHGLLAEGFVLRVRLGMGGEFVLVVSLLG